MVRVGIGAAAGKARADRSFQMPERLCVVVAVLPGPAICTSPHPPAKKWGVPPPPPAALKAKFGGALPKPPAASSKPNALAAALDDDDDLDDDFADLTGGLSASALGMGQRAVASIGLLLLLLWGCSQRTELI